MSDFDMSCMDELEANFMISDNLFYDNNDEYADDEHDTVAMGAFGAAATNPIVSGEQYDADDDATTGQLVYSNQAGDAADHDDDDDDYDNYYHCHTNDGDGNCGKLCGGGDTESHQDELEDADSQRIPMNNELSMNQMVA